MIALDLERIVQLIQQFQTTLLLASHQFDIPPIEILPTIDSTNEYLKHQHSIRTKCHPQNIPEQFVCRQGGNECTAGMYINIHDGCKRGSQHSIRTKCHSQNIPEQFVCRQGGNECTAGLYINIHDGCKRGSQHSIQTKCDGYKVCLAEEQTKGRGRADKTWYSPTGANIYFSCCYNFSLTHQQLNGLSIVVGLATLKTLQELFFASPLNNVELYKKSDSLKIKWPNDILWHDKKLVGILVELLTEPDKSIDAIIGIGINVNMPKLAEQNIDKPFTSLNYILNAEQDRNLIVALLICNLSVYLKRFAKSGFKDFLGEWQQVDYLFGKNKTFKYNQQEITGRCVGINEQGHLLVALEDDKIVAIIA